MITRVYTIVKLTELNSPEVCILLHLIYTSVFKKSFNSRIALEHTFFNVLAPMFRNDYVLIVCDPEYCYQAFVKEHTQTADFLFCFMVKGFCFFPK